MRPRPHCALPCWADACVKHEVLLPFSSFAENVLRRRRWLAGAATPRRHPDPHRPNRTHLHHPPRQQAAVPRPVRADRRTVATRTRTRRRTHRRAWGDDAQTTTTSPNATNHHPSRCSPTSQAFSHAQDVRRPKGGTARRLRGTRIRVARRRPATGGAVASTRPSESRPCSAARASPSTARPPR
jgi:hypothetical protein